MIETYKRLYVPDAARPTTSSPEPGTRVRVVHIIDHLNVGGAQRQLVELVRRLPNETWEPIVVALSTREIALAGELNKTGILVHLIDQHGTLDLRCLWRLWRFLRCSRPQLVHTWLFTADCYGRVAAKLAGVPHVISGIRSPVDDMPWHHRLVNRWLTHWTSAVTVNAEAIRSGYVREGGISAEKIRTIPNGFDLEGLLITPLPPEAWRKWGVDLARPLVAMVARLAPPKDHETFLRAMAQVVAVHPDAQALLVGEGPLRERIAYRIGELGLRNAVRMTGRIQNVGGLLSEVECSVLATHYEGSSNVILEAMAMSKPVVASDVGGNRELIVHGETGFLVPPRDPARLAEAILEVLSDRARASAMGIRARKRVEAHFTIQESVKQTAALYQELLAGARWAVE